MPYFVINANGTFQVKTGQGVINQIIVASAGSAWTIQIKDGPDPVTAAFTTVVGAAPMTIAGAGATLTPRGPLQFSKGIQIIMAGTTPGELDVDFT